MKPYPLALREGIVQAVLEGRGRAVVRHDFGVSRDTVDRYVRQWQERGDLAPKPIPGARPRIPMDQHDALRAQLQNHPGARLADHCRWWEVSQGTCVSVATMCRTIGRLGWRR